MSNFDGAIKDISGIGTSSNPSVFNPRAGRRESYKWPYEMSARGDRYLLTKEGYITRTDMPMGPHYNIPGPDWKVYGIALKWNAKPGSMSWLPWAHIAMMLDGKLDKQADHVKGYLWDVDHGSVRMWGGRYQGKLPTATIRRFTY